MSELSGKTEAGTAGLSSGGPAARGKWLIRAGYWGVPPLAALALILEFPWRFEAHLDLEVYRLGLRAWWHGQDIYGLLPRTSAGILLPFIYPPFAVIALGPLALLPWDAAVAVLFAANLFCLGGTLFLVTRRAWPAAGRRGALLVTAAALPAAMALEPLRETFAFGQVNLLLMGLVAVDCLTGTTRWPRGLGVGLAAAIKLTPLAFVLFFVARKDYRAATTAVLTAVGASALGFVIDARISVEYWFGGLAGAGGLSGSPYRTNQSIEAVLVRLGLPGGTAKLWWVALSLLLLVLAAVAIQRSDQVVALVATVGFALLASPISWSHHWVWVAPALLVMVLYGLRRTREAARAAAAGWWTCAVLVATLCIVAPFRFLPAHDKPGMVWTPLQQLPGNSYALLGTVLLVAYAVAKIRNGKQRAVTALPVTTPPDAIGARPRPGSP